MRCRDCAEGKQFTGDSWYCVMYGMIIREKEKCTRKGARQRERDEDKRGEGDNKAEIRPDGERSA